MLCVLHVRSYCSCEHLVHYIHMPALRGTIWVTGKAIWGEPERAPHSRDSCGHRRGRDRDRSWSCRVVCPHYVTSRSARVVVAWSGLGTSCTPQSGLAWGRVVHFRVWLNEDRDAEQKKALRREQSG